MIVDFTLENFGPFKGEVTLSFLSAISGNLPENILHSDAIQGGLLNTAAIFGPNATGKSYIISAFSALQAMVSSPVPTDFRYPWYIPFKLSKETVDAPIKLRIRLIIDGVLHSYSISYNSERILHETLSTYPEGRKNTVFSREGDVYKFGRSLAKGQKMISELTSEGSSYLAVAAQFNNLLCHKVQHAITKDIMVVPCDRDEMLHDAVVLMTRNPRVKSYVLRALEIADYGISDIGWETQINEMSPSSTSAWTSEHTERSGVWIKHKSSAIADEQNPRISVEMSSRGTIEFIGVIAPIAEALLDGKSVLIDEFSSHLHPAVSKWIFSQFTDEANPNNAQLLVTTNDHTLMDLVNIMRKDQVYFTQRDSFTRSSDLFSLFDFDEGWLDEDLSVRIPNIYQSMPYISGKKLL